MTIQELKERFIKEYGDEGELRVFSAAGRVNLIGEHIDYCGGKVFPAALNLACVIIARKRTDNIIRMRATTIDHKVELSTTKLNDYRELPWGAYQAGVAYVMQNEGHKIVGCDLLFDANVPFGSGLSSSAAIEVATAITFATFSSEAGGKGADLVKLAVMSQKAENEYARVNCGIMDQFASALGRRNKAILLDCATLEYTYVPLNLKDYELVIANCNKKRSLQDSKYNERRGECEAALKLLKTRLPNIKNLAEVSVADFEKNKDVLNGKILDRATHVIYECDRVSKSVLELSRGNVLEFGALLNESHYSLRDLYEVTGKELDTLSELIRSYEGCIGSRMTGAGFGGCTVSLVKKDKVQKLIADVEKEYEKIIGYKPSFYKGISIEDGAFEIY